MDHQAKVAAPASRAPDAGLRSGSDPLALTDLRPAAAAQRHLQSLAGEAAQARTLGALQRMADQRSARQGPLTPLPPATRLQPIQRIKGGVQTNVGKKVTEKEKGKETIVGEITGLQGISHYLVQFPGEAKPRAVLATKLVFSRGGGKDADETAEDATPAPTSTDLSSDDEPSAASSLSSAPMPSSSSSSSPSARAPAAQFTHLQIEPSGNRWILTLLSNGREVARTEPLANGTVKNYTTTIVTPALLKPKPGTFALVSGVVLKAELAQAYETAEKARKREVERQANSNELASQVDLRSGQQSQAEILARLKALEGVKDQSGRGNPLMQMTSIALVSDIYLVVGGVEHRITHLYTQPGNQTEIRCYLGTKDGAYQRVHTSLTADNSSHTMIQTSDLVSTPANERGGADRMGWDAQEGVLSDAAKDRLRAPAEPSERKGKAPAPDAVMGFAVRKLDVRPKERCDVTNLGLKGQRWEQLKPDQQKGCELLAIRFNTALDQVCADIMSGEIAKRDVRKIGSDFATLDDSWLFEPPGLSPAPKVAATPDEEYRRRDGPIDRSEREARERGRGGASSSSSSSSLSSPSWSSSSSSSLTSPSWSSSSSSSLSAPSASLSPPSSSPSLSSPTLSPPSSSSPAPPSSAPRPGAPSSSLSPPTPTLSSPSSSVASSTSPAAEAEVEEGGK